MSRYAPLGDHLRARVSPVGMTFDQVADVVGGLPPSAYRYRQWWENDRSHVQEAARICGLCRHEYAAASG